MRVTKGFHIVSAYFYNMKSPAASIHTYDINEINLHAAVKAATNDFYVYRKEEMPNHTKMFRPSRSMYFLQFSCICTARWKLKSTLFLI